MSDEQIKAFAKTLDPQEPVAMLTVWNRGESYGKEGQVDMIGLASLIVRLQDRALIEGLMSSPKWDQRERVLLRGQEWAGANTSLEETVAREAMKLGDIETLRALEAKMRAQPPERGHVATRARLHWRDIKETPLGHLAFAIELTPERAGACLDWALGLLDEMAQASYPSESESGKKKSKGFKEVESMFEALRRSTLQETLMLSAQTGALELAQALMERGAVATASMIDEAISSGSWELGWMLLEQARKNATEHALATNKEREHERNSWSRRGSEEEPQELTLLMSLANHARQALMDVSKWKEASRKKNLDHWELTEWKKKEKETVDQLIRALEDGLILPSQEHPSEAAQAGKERMAAELMPRLSALEDDQAKRLEKALRAACPMPIMDEIETLMKKGKKRLLKERLKDADQHGAFAKEEVDRWWKQLGRELELRLDDMKIDWGDPNEKDASDRSLGKADLMELGMIAALSQGCGLGKDISQLSNSMWDYGVDSKKRQALAQMSALIESKALGKTAKPAHKTSKTIRM